jgi:hypothetical protein
MKGRGATYLPRGAPLSTGGLRLNLRFTLVAEAVLRARGVLSTPNCEECKRRCICRARPNAAGETSRLPFAAVFAAKREPRRGTSGALAEGLEEERGGGGGDVEGVDLAAAGQGDEAVAARRDAGAQALALAAEDEDGLAGQVDAPGRLVRIGVGAPDPEAGLLRLSEPAEALQTTAVTAAERRSGITTPAAPANSAERQTAPRFLGSWTWSSATIRASSLRSIPTGSPYG